MLLPGSVLVAGVVLSLSFFLSIRHWAAIEREKQAARTVHEQVEKLQQSMLRSMEVLHSIAALHHTRGNFQRDEFKSFVQLALQRQPELQALSWNPVVTAAQRTAFERAARAAGLDGYCFREHGPGGALIPAGVRATYVPVYMIEPLPRNGLAVGFDLNSDPVRRQSIALAQASGQAVASAPVRLAQGNANEPGFLVVLPVYEDVPQGTATTSNSPAGFAVAVFRLKDLVQQTFESLRNKGIGAVLYDESTRGEVIYTAAKPTSADKAANSAVARFDVANRHWALTYAVTPQFSTSQGDWQSWLVLAGGLAFTLLTIGYLRNNEHHTRAMQGVNANLLEEVSVRKQAEAAAAAASEAKSTFLTNMSHEMRTPLNAILGHAQIMQRAITGQEHCESLEQIRSSGNHLLGLINEMLDLAKIEAGKMEIHAVNFLLKALGQSLEATLRPLCLEKGIRLTFRWNGPADAQVHGDETRLRQVLLNLLGNAVKFTEAGEVCFQFQALGQDRWLFEVNDTGPGIPASEQPQVFQPFYQSTHLAQAGGTGLGLAIAQKQTTLLGGNLELESTLGMGSRFYFTISLPPAEIRLSAAEPTTMSHGSNEAFELLIPTLPESICVRLAVAAEFHSMTGLKTALHQLREFGPEGILFAERISIHLRSYDMEAIQRLVARLNQNSIRGDLRPAHAITVH